MTASAPVVTAHELPTYDELPVVPGLGLPHAWDLLDHDRGSLSLIDDERRLSAASQVQRGESIGLNLPLDELDPPLFGRARIRHTVIDVGRNTHEDVLDGFNPQAGSQWDGLRHVRAREHGYFGGLADLRDPAPLGIQHWAATGIVGRGVLLDVSRWAAEGGRPLDAFAGTEVTASDLDACAAAQGVRVEPGDVVCLRFGWTTAYRALEPAARAGSALGAAFSGLRADDATAQWVWDHRIGALCADNPALECAPGDPAIGSLHRRLIPLLGTAVAELLDLDRLAHRCAELGRWTFLFVAVPLPLTGGVSSPSNALALL
ncbi:cyclase family protein [Nocardioides carbamazepini]|uniref:cyclase family protein n=1 Tax=Nocardioides carbamazepini TaxID=2854259 RepID=UPI00214A6B02|nr:cyclase family protein [Nocardioides carbamazepini]MCR1783674.1 cyclase family protein [Nocardioides carbamazepini]